MPSSVINHFNYDHKGSTLYITFVSGITYKYKNVPQQIYQMLKAAGSKGRYFNYHIKNKLKYKRIES
jgi:hypothetical protein